MLHSVFERALRRPRHDVQPLRAHRAPKGSRRRPAPLPPPSTTRPRRVAAQHRLMVETAINTGLRWGELIALKPRHLDLAAGGSRWKRPSSRSPRRTPPPAADAHQGLPQGQRTPHPGTPARLVDLLTDHQPATARARRPAVRHPRRHPDLWNTFRTRVWLPAVQASGVDFDVRVHDLRHAHASWLLAGGSDLKAVMDRMGHAQITTTQKYLHPMPDADTKNLTALNRIRNPEQPGGGEPWRGARPRVGPGTDQLVSPPPLSAPGATNGHAGSRDGSSDPLAIPVRESGCRTATICSGLNLFEAAIRNSHWSSHLWMDSHKIWTEDGAVQGHKRGLTQIAIESSLPNMTSRRSAERRRPRSRRDIDRRGPRWPTRLAPTPDLTPTPPETGRDHRRPRLL